MIPIRSLDPFDSPDLPDLFAFASSDLFDSSSDLDPFSDELTSSSSSVCFSSSVLNSPHSLFKTYLPSPTVMRQHDEDEALNSMKTIPNRSRRKTGNSTPRKRKESNKINEDQWSAVAVSKSLDLLQFGEPSKEITEADFKDLKEEDNRVDLPAKLLPACKKLPWFHQLNVRFRQNLAKKRRHGVTLQDVVRAMNFLFRRAYSDDEINFLGNYFRAMEVPINAECLSTIVEVAEDFNRYLETGKRQSQVTGSGKKRARVVSELVDAHDHNSRLLRVSQITSVTTVLGENSELLISHQEISQRHDHGHGH
jgi:hypothetical protein